jgi:hypothetical protein
VRGRLIKPRLTAIAWDENVDREVNWFYQLLEERSVGDFSAIDCIHESAGKIDGIDLL